MTCRGDISVHSGLTQTIPVGQSEREDVNGTKWTVTTFHTSPRMPTYVVAFAICDFDSVSQTERGKEVSEGMALEKGPSPLRGLTCVPSILSPMSFESFQGVLAEGDRRIPVVR